MDGRINTATFGLFNTVLHQCAPFHVPRPWQFLSVDHQQYRGTIENPNAALAQLQRLFIVEGVLNAANLVEFSSAGLRLRPELCNPAGAVMALRSAPNSTSCLVTARGSLPHRLDPWVLADMDADTRLADHRLLLVTFTVQDAILLRSIGLPAVFGSGMHRLLPLSLKALNKFCLALDYHPAMPAEAESASPQAATGASAEPARPEPQRPPRKSRQVTIVLVGWSPYRLTFPFGSQLTRVADQLSQWRRHGGMQFGGVYVWSPSASVIERLRFFLQKEYLEGVRNVICDSLAELTDAEKFASPNVSLSPPDDLDALDLIAVKARLFELLARDHADRAEIQRVTERYRQLVWRDLVEPCQAWALAHPNPVVRLAAMQLADSAGVLHQASPFLQAGQNREIAGVDGDLADAASLRELDGWLRLIDQHTSLLRDVCRMRGF